VHFQCVAFDKLPLNLTYDPNRGKIEEGDYVELLAHDDVWAIVSPYPVGDQNHTGKYENMVCWLFRTAIYEGTDGPLETAPDPLHKSMEPYNFIKAGRPGMVTPKLGKKSSPTCLSPNVQLLITAKQGRPNQAVDG
jgi:hypothetical protein